jgi:hypothetical protein
MSDDLPLKVTVKRRLEREGRWSSEVEPVRNQLMREAVASGMSKTDAQDWTYAELDRRYPQLEQTGTVTGPAGDVATADDHPARPRELEPPADWPELPANAALASEIQWVQANRLRVTTPDGQVDLSKALGPAPSHATLGWLETSIRAYAKYCDIAARATQGHEDERESVRREVLAINEVRALLGE